MAVLCWHSPIEQLFKGKGPKAIDKLKSANISLLEDLLWIFPNHIEKIPATAPFKNASADYLFQGEGTILSLHSSAVANKKAPLQNITATIKDSLSSATINLKWFNAYPSTYHQLKKLSKINFLGKPSQFRGELYIANPRLLKSPISAGSSEAMVQYPTINGVSGSKIEGILSRIPKELWNNIDDKVPVPSNYKIKRQTAFLALHGKLESCPGTDALKLLAYEEFYCEQLKILIRKKTQKAIPAKTISDEISPQDFFHFFPYQLTDDQKKTCDEIVQDLASGMPMMRLLQGDVGCGKTTVAIISSLIGIKSGWQVALMCPTESLAFQHFHELKEIAYKNKINIELLTGSISPKGKSKIKERLQDGSIQLIIGTHALIESSTIFKNLGLVIIDEQHKFGVNQRLKLTHKDGVTHCLIMSATPIPRSLSLTQYGDLDISIIKTLPKNRKKIQTRIVLKINFGTFLNFLKTRLNLHEQIYVVTPAILDNEEQDLLNVERVYKRFSSFFPETRIACLHGKMSPDEKQKTFLDFSRQKIDLLISTSVIEVGINVPTATVMAVLNPERFGLSSLHQLRGRVGRAEKPGFCFLVCDKNPSAQALERLTIIEKSTDGFVIAEHDLRLRGEGALFGTSQSGKNSQHRVANAIQHYQQLKDARDYVQNVDLEKCPLTTNILCQLEGSDAIISTI